MFDQGAGVDPASSSMIRDRPTAFASRQRRSPWSNCRGMGLGGKHKRACRPAASDVAADQADPQGLVGATLSARALNPGLLARHNCSNSTTHTHPPTNTPNQQPLKHETTFGHSTTPTRTHCLSCRTPSGFVHLRTLPRADLGVATHGTCCVGPLAEAGNVKGVIAQHGQQARGHWVEALWRRETTAIMRLMQGRLGCGGPHVRPPYLRGAGLPRPGLLRQDARPIARCD